MTVTLHWLREWIKRYDIEETPCPRRSDKQHCRHWYDGEACCACGDPPMSNEAKTAQGMPVGGGER